MVLVCVREPAYNVTVEKDTRGFNISAVKSQFNNEGMETSRVIKGLTYTDKKTNAVIDKENAGFVYQNNSFTGEYFKFYLNETFADRQGDVLLKLTYKTPIVSYSTESTTISIIQTLLVIADDSMVK